MLTSGYRKLDGRMNVCWYSENFLIQHIFVYSYNFTSHPKGFKILLLSLSLLLQTILNPSGDLLFVSFFASIKVWSEFERQRVFSGVRGSPLHFLTVHFERGPLFHQPLTHVHAEGIPKCSISSHRSPFWLNLPSVHAAGTCSFAILPDRRTHPAASWPAIQGNVALQSLKARRSSLMESKSAVCCINSLRGGKTNRRLTCFSSKPHLEFTPTSLFPSATS